METDLFITVKAALQYQLNTVLTDLLPGGRIQGREYVCGSINGGSGSSCKTSLRTGVGSDFATGQKWGDAIALTALVMKCNQEEAARFLAEEYHIDIATPRKAAVRKTKTAAKTEMLAATPIMPVPDSAPEFPERYRKCPALVLSGRGW